MPVLAGLMHNDLMIIAGFGLPLIGAAVVDIVIAEFGMFRMQRQWSSDCSVIEPAPVMTLEEIQAKARSRVDSTPQAA